jgi:hypothetical protein
MASGICHSSCVACIRGLAAVGSRYPQLALWATNMTSAMPTRALPHGPAIAPFGDQAKAATGRRTANQPVPGGIFTLGMPRRIILCRRATRLGFTWGLKTVRGLGIIAERNAASRAFRLAAGL